MTVRVILSPWLYRLYEVNDIGDSSETQCVLKNNEIIENQTDVNGDWKRATVVGRAGEATRKCRHYCSMRNTMSGEVQELNLEGLKTWT